MDHFIRKVFKDATWEILDREVKMARRMAEQDPRYEMLDCGCCDNICIELPVLQGNYWIITTSFVGQ